MIGKIISPIVNLLQFHKKKLALLLGLYLAFVYILFPSNDLGDFVAAKISEATQGQFFLNFDSLSLSLLPRTGVSLSNVDIESSYFPNLSAKSVSISPDILSFLAFRPGVAVHGSGFLGGSVDIDAAVGDKTQSTPVHRKQKIEMGAYNLDLSSLTRIADLPMKLEGALSGNIDSQIDPEFSEQPYADINLQTKKMVIPEGNIITPLGPLGLPKVNLGELILQARADKGQLEITRVTAGHPGGDLYANIIGKMDIKVLKLGQSIQPQPGAYDFTVKLQIGEAVRQKLGSFLSILQSYQAGSNTYAFRISAPNTFSPPNIVKSTGP